MKAFVNRMLAADLPFNVYITGYGKTKAGATPHAFDGLPVFHAVEEGGVRHVDWLEANVIRDEPSSAGVKLLDWSKLRTL